MLAHPRRPSSPEFISFLCTPALRQRTERVFRRSASLLAMPLLLLGIGCSSRNAAPAAKPAGPAMKPAPATPIAEQKNQLGSSKTWDPAWDTLVEEALPPDLLSATAARAVAGFCPRFASVPEADKRAFWAYLFQALAGAEAGLDPTIQVRHTQAAVSRIDKVSQHPVRQEGLLQLTYDDSDRYRCDFNWQHDRRLPEKDPTRTILRPANNLGCGVRIIENQIIRRRKPLVSRTSYWSTLQPGTSSYAVFAKQMANVPAACGIGSLKPSRR